MEFAKGGFSSFEVIVAFLTTAIAIIIFTTRLGTAYASLSFKRASRGIEPPLIPYWVPFVGHLTMVLYDPESLLEQARDWFFAGIFSLNLGGYRHHVLYHQLFINNVLSVEENSFASQSVRPTVMVNVFGLESKYRDLYGSMEAELQAAVLPHLQFENGTSANSAALVTHMLGSLPDLITFNTSVVDQEPWERLSLLTSTSDPGAVDASLLPLVHTFLTHITLDTLFTPSILSDSDRHEIAPLLLAFSQFHAVLVPGLPRTMPHPSLPAAHLVRMRLSEHLQKLSDDILEDFDMQSPLLVARQTVLEKYEAPSRLRTADLLSLLWELNSPNILAFWLLLHIISDETLLAHIRKETRPYIHTVYEAPVMGFNVPPRINVDAENLVDQCPLLRSAYIETVRLYSRGLSSIRVTEDSVIEAGGQTLFKERDKWVVRKGEYVNIPFWLTNNDPSVLPKPEVWDADRHLRTNDEGDNVAEWGVFYSNYGIFGLDGAREFGERTCIAFITSVLAVWDFTSMDGEALKIPRAKFAAGVALPDGDIRVRIQRRDVSIKERRLTP